MGEKALVIGHLERAIAEVIRASMAERGWSAPQLAAASGLNRSRVYTLLGSKSPMTVSTLESLCAALGTSVSAVVREAEEAVAAAGEAPASVPRPAAREREVGRLLPFPERHPRHGVPVVPDEVLARAAASVRPERERELAETTGWRSDLGEEPQVSPESEED